MKKFDNVIKNSTIMTASDTYSKGTGIRDGVIAAIDAEFKGILADAEVQYVNPTEVDARTPFDPDFSGFPLSGQYSTGSKTAVRSGVDTALHDPRKKIAIIKSILRKNSDYKLYENVKVTGYPPQALPRGEIVDGDGEYVEKEVSGRYFKKPLPVLL